MNHFKGPYFISVNIISRVSDFAGGEMEVLISPQEMWDGQVNIGIEQNLDSARLYGNLTQYNTLQTPVSGYYVIKKN